MGEIERILQCKDDSYKVLDLPRSSTKEQAKSKYKKLVVKIHPDRNPNPKASEAFIVLKKAYEDIVEDKPQNSQDMYRNRRSSHGNISQEDLEQFIKWYMHAQSVRTGFFTAGPFGGGFGPIGGMDGRRFRRQNPATIEISNRIGIILLVFFFLYSLLR